MKTQKLTIIFTFLAFSALLLGCAAPPPVPPSATETDMTLETVTEVPPATLVPEEPSRFTIKAQPELERPVAVLYQAFFPDETATFVDEDADLLATTSSDSSDGRPNVSATFLPESVLIPMSDSEDVEEFIAFAISAEGQQVLIDEGELPSTVSLTDQAGNIITIGQPVRRVISTYGPATALIYSVDAEERLVSASYLGARDPLGAAAMERIDPRFSAIMGDDSFTQQDFNVEQAAALDPDLIVTSARTAWLDTVDQLGISVFLFDAETPERLKEAVLLTGQLFGPHSTAQAQAWVDYYEGAVSRIEEQISDIPEDERVRVLFTGTDPLRVASGEMYQTDIIELAGGISVSDDLTGFWNDVNLEQIAIWDPDVVIVPPYGGASVEAITESSEWQILQAVQEGRVYRMPKLVVPWDTPAPDSVLGIIWMAQRLNPDLVDLGCADEAEYFYNTFYDYAITAEEIESICQID